MTGLLLLVVAVTVTLVGAFPGTTSTIVDAVANGVTEWIAAAASGLQGSMARHDPTSTAPVHSRARRFIGACIMTGLLVPLLPAEGYLIFLGVTGLLGLDIGESAVADAGAQHTATGGGLWDRIATFDTALLIKLAVASSIMASVIVAVMWAYDERYLERPENPAIRRSLDWTARIAKGAALTTLLVAALHRATASLDFGTPAVAVDVPHTQVADTESLRSADKYMAENAPIVTPAAASSIVLPPWVRPTLTVVGTIASATAPTAASVIAFLYGPVALAGQLWSLVLLLTAAALIVVSRTVGTAVEATRAILRLAIETCSSVMLPLITWCRVQYDREHASRAANRQFSRLRLVLCSWVLLVETERLARLREASPGGAGDIAGAGAAPKFPGTGIGQANRDQSMQADSEETRANDWQNGSAADNTATVPTNEAAGERIYHAYAGSPATTDPISQGASNE